MKKIFPLLLFLYLCLCCAHSFADPNNPRIVMETTYGDFVIELFPNEAPITVDNFLHYVNTNFYNDTLIHRVVTFPETYSIIQGGGYYATGYSIIQKSPDRPAIVNESYNGLSNLRGTIAMARTSLGPDTATNQFFINQIDNTYFDKANYPDGFGYCVFGKVVYGMETVDIITALNTYYLSSALADFPIPPPDIYAANEATDNFWFKSDFNYDGIVDEQDLGIIAENWLSSVQLGDLEVNGIVDFKEFAQFSQNWNQASNGYRIFAGDINNDKKVNFADFSLLAQSWNQPSTSRLYGDLNLDGKVDPVDLSLLAEDWLKSVE